MSVRYAIIKKSLDLPLPIYLSGYSDRQQPATAIHDPLNISCFYLSTAEKEVAVFGLDILGIYDGYYEKLTKAVTDAVARPNLAVVFSSAHTHSAPGFDHFRSHQDLHRQEFLQEIIAKATMILQEAPQLAQPATLSYFEKPLDNVGANRRNKNVKVNTVLRTLNFNFADKKAVIVNFNCHPTHMSAKNLLISKDYQGAAMDELETQGYLPMFLQGACGDVSTRFTRKEQTFEDMARIAHIFAEEIKTAQPGMPLEITDFDYREYNFEIPKKQYQTPEFYRQEIAKYQKKLEDNRGTMAAADLRLYETALQGIQVESQYAEFQDKIVTAVRCGILRLGQQAALVFLPFELFSKIADQITAAAKIPFTMIIGYSFDGLGYLPDLASFDQSGYEVLSCTYQKGAGETVADKVSELLNN